MRLALCALMLICGCDSADESQCSDPYTIGFGPMVDLLQPPAPVPVGTTVVATVKCSTEGHAVLPLDHPYRIDDHGGAFVRAAATSRGLELTGVAPGSNDLRIWNDDVDQTFVLTAVAP